MTDTELRSLGAMDWKWTVGMGVVLLVGGLVSLLFPFIASLTVTGFASAAFLIGGAVQLWLAIRGREGSSGGRLVAGILGVLMILLALSLWFDPLAGLLTLTLAVAFFFVAMGAARIWVASRMRHRSRWGWVAASGAMSILLGLVILLFLPASAVTTLGLLLGIELTISGVGAIALGLAARAS